MTAYRDRLAELTDATRRQIDRLWSRHVDGDISREQFVTLAAAVIAQANVRATSLADLALAAALTMSLRRATPPLGLVPDEAHIDQSRLRHAVREVLDADVVTAANRAELVASQAVRLGRIARDEPPGTASAAMTTAMREREVSGWTRVTDVKPCPLCQEWDDGQVRPPTVQMARHTGCGCTQQPVVA